MKRELSHDEAWIALDALALDALEASEREAVLAHVDGCERCRAELDTLHSAAAQVAYAAATGSGGATRQRVRARLLARATAVPVKPLLHSIPRQTEPAASQDSLRRARFVNVLAWRRAEWMALAASVLIVVSVGMLAAVLKDRSNIQEALKAQLALSQSAITASDSLRLVVASRDTLIAGLTGRDVAVMSLTSTGTNAPFARMFWDRAHNTWTLVAHNMPALKTGRTYQLWLVTASGKISAGTFDPRNGDAVMRATYALAPASLRALAVTEEPAGGAPQPTGAMVIAVSAQ